MDTTAPEQRLVLGIAGATGVAGALMGCRPTGFLPADVVFTTIVVGVAVVGGAATPPVWLLGVAIGATVVGSTSPWAFAGITAALIALWQIRRGEAVSPPAGAVAGAASASLSSLTLLNLGAGPVVGSTALVAAAGFGVFWWHAWKELDASSRRRVSRIGLGVAGVAAACVLIAGTAVLGGKSDAEQGVSAARAGLDLAREGDLEGASLALTEAQAAFESANSSFGAWWATPARFVPIVGQQIGALDTASAQGGRIAVAAIDALATSDIEAMWVDGAVDVAALTALQDPLSGSVSTLEVAKSALAGARSPWLAAPIADRLTQLVDELDDVSVDLDVAGDAIGAVPRLVGAEGPRTYLVLFATPSETRELGGIVGSVAALTFDDGRMTFAETVLNEELNALATGRGLADPGAYPSRFVANEPERYSQNWTGTVDFPNAARAVRELYPQMGGGAIDGVIYVDPIAIEAIMTITGPIEVPGIDRTLGVGEIVEWLIRGQYIEFQEQSERASFLGEVSKAALDGLLGAQIPDVGSLVSTLAPAVDGGHLRFTTFHEEDTAFLDQLGIVGAFDPPPGDVLAVVQANASEDKLDAFLHRSITYDAMLDPAERVVHSNVSVELTNRVPADAPSYMVGGPDGLYPRGTNVVQLSVVTANTLATVSVDGDPTSAERNDEVGFNRYTVFVPVPPGETRTIDFATDGVLNDPESYRVWWHTPPRINADVAALRVRTKGGGSVSLAGDDGGSLSVERFRHRIELDVDAVGNRTFDFDVVNP